MKLIIVLVSVLSLPLFAQAQVKAYIEPPQNWKGPQFVIDGKSYAPKFWSGPSEIVEAMKSNPEASAFAEKASSQAKWSSGLFWGFLAGALAYSNTADYRRDTYWYIIGAGLIPSAVLRGESEINTLRAINAYNGVKSKTSMLMPNQFFLAPTAGGTQAAVGWSF